MRMRTTLVIAAVQLGVNATAAQGQCAPAQVGAIAFTEPFSDILAHGSLVYAATPTGIQVFDVSDPSVPLHLSSLQIQSGVLRLAIQGEILCALGSNTFWTVDVSEPVEPVILGTIGLSTDGRALVCDGTTAFADGNGITAIDFSDPTLPRLLGSVAPGIARDIALYGTRLCAVGSWGTNNYKLVVVDVTDPTAMILIAEMGLGSGSDYAHALSVSNGFVYAAVEQQVYSLDLSYMPPLQRDQRGVGMTPRDVLASGISLLVAGDEGLAVYDIFDPSHIVLVAEADGSVDLTRLVLSAGHVFAAINDGADESAVVFDVVDCLYQPECELGLPSTTGLPSGAAVVASDGELAATHAGANVITILDVSDPTDPVVLSEYEAGSSVQDLAIADHRLYFTALTYLEAVDVANGAEPQLLGRADLPSYARGVTIRDGVAFVCGSSSGVHIIDVQDMNSPSVLSSVDTAYAYDLTLLGDTMFVADGNSGVHVIDVSDPSLPVSLGTTPIGGSVKQIAGAGTLLLAHDGVMHLIDASDPGDLIDLGLLTNWAGDLVRSGEWIAPGLAALAAGRYVDLLDVSYPSDPVTVATRRIAGEAVTLAGMRPYTTVATGEDAGIAILDMTSCEQCPPDLNGDGLVNTQDFIAFLNAWASGDPLADWNDDGTINTQDFIAYLNDWAAGC